MNLAPFDDFKVSVVIPTYNRAHFLPEAIRSVLAQTVPVYEIIVVDDDSTDNTVEVLAPFGDKIRYFKQKNQGPSAARNYAMREAKGNWIAFLDSDDLWVPEKNQLQLEFLRQHPTIDFVFGNLTNFNEQKCDETPEILDAKVYAYFQANSAHLKDFLLQLLLCNPVPTSAALFRTTTLPQTGPLDEKMRYCEDYDFWLRLALVGQVGFVDRILVKRRMHECNAIKAYIALCEGTLKAFNRLNQNAKLSAEAQQILNRRMTSIQYNLSSYRLKCGEFDEASAGFAELRAKKSAGSLLWYAKVYTKSLMANTMRKLT